MVTKVYFYDDVSLIRTYEVCNDPFNFYIHMQRLHTYIMSLSISTWELQSYNVDFIDQYLPRVVNVYYEKKCEMRTFESVYAYFNREYVAFHEYTGEIL